MCGSLHRREIGDHRGQGLLGRHQPQRHLGDHAQRALAADEQLGQAQPGNVLQTGPTEPDRGAVGQHHLNAKYVVGGDAVFHAAQPAGVGRDVAADAADLIRRRVGRVPQAVLGDGLLHLGVEQPGLADRGTRDGVDDDVAHLLRRQHDSAVDRGGATGQTGAHAAGHHRYLVGGRPPQNGLHLFGPQRAHDGQGFARRRIQRAVLPVSLGDRGIGDDHSLGQLGNQAGQRISGHGSDPTDTVSRRWYTVEL